jgi:hypothetical protein
VHELVERGRGRAHPPFRLGAQSFQRRYLAALQMLPDCEIGLRHDASPTTMAHVRFAGGRGLIMPTRVRA